MSQSTMINEQINAQGLNDEFCHLMLDYASGALDEGMALVMASYVSLSPYAQVQLRYLETIGGALMCADGHPERMKDESLAQCLSLLDNIESIKDREQPDKPRVLPDFPAASKVPMPILKHIADHSAKSPRWTKSFKGMEMIDIPLSETCQSNVRLMRIAPGTATPAHSHQGIELTLVLDGAFTDENGRFEAGNIIVHYDDTHHEPVACPQQGCICIVATDAPIRFTKGWLKLLNPFVK